MCVRVGCVPVIGSIRHVCSCRLRACDWVPPPPASEWFQFPPVMPVVDPPAQSFSWVMNFKNSRSQEGNKPFKVFPMKTFLHTMESPTCTGRGLGVLLGSSGNNHTFWMSTPGLDVYPIITATSRSFGKKLSEWVPPLRLGALR